MMDIRLIALDMDGTLLTTDKRLTDRSRRALERVNARGIIVVPTTGRIFVGLPQEIRALSFLRYAVTSNGATVYDVARDETIYRAEIPAAQAVEILQWLDDFPVIYDCYMDGRGWMTEAMWNQAEIYAPSKYYLQMIRTLRKPVPELKAFLRQRGSDVQKLQAFSREDALRQRLLRELPRRFPGLAVSSSGPNNVEINHGDANKGAALLALARHLGLERQQILAFGDGLNDISMIRAAGFSVAMGNAIDELKREADRIAPGNDEDGVAQVLEALFPDA